MKVALAEVEPEGRICDDSGLNGVHHLGEELIHLFGPLDQVAAAAGRPRHIVEQAAIVVIADAAHHKGDGCLFGQAGAFILIVGLPIGQNDDLAHGRRFG